LRRIATLGPVRLALRRDAEIESAHIERVCVLAGGVSHLGQSAKGRAVVLKFTVRLAVDSLPPEHEKRGLPLGQNALEEL
jgi:hypothetical protein